MFVPAHRDRYVVRAAQCDADAIVLDLEDSVPTSMRPQARTALASAIRTLIDVPVLVRVNSGTDLRVDLVACRDSGVVEVLLPKVDHERDLFEFESICTEIGYRPTLSILIESARGLARAHFILAATDISAVALGTEDVRAELEMYAPTPDVSETLALAHSSLILAALGADVIPLGLVGSIAEIDNENLIRQSAARSWRMGYRGSFCIHPDQVQFLNAEFRPSTTDLRWAHDVRLVAETAYENGHGAFRVDGRMVDAPMVTRAERLIAYAAVLSNIDDQMQ